MEPQKQDEEIKSETKTNGKNPKETSNFENKIKVPMKMEFKNQENDQKYFFILHIPQYSKENCHCCTLFQEV